MPGFDKTGPDGRGAMTGGGYGQCAGSTKRSEPADRMRGAGRGGRPWGGARGRCFGGGRYKGRGMRGRGLDTTVTENDLALEEQIAQLICENEELRQRISQLESESS